MACRFSFAPLGEPGKVTMMVLFLTPASGRDIMATKNKDLAYWMPSPDSRAGRTYMVSRIAKQITCREQDPWLVCEAAVQQPEKDSVSKRKRHEKSQCEYLWCYIRHCEACSACSDDEIRGVCAISPGSDAGLNLQDIISHNLCVRDLPFPVSFVGEDLVEDLARRVR